MVGVAVGLFVAGGAAKLFVDNLSNNRRMLVETRINQDLRAATDLIARDLRRAGYWRNAHLQTPPPLTAAVACKSYSYSIACANGSAGRT